MKAPTGDALARMMALRAALVAERWEAAEIAASWDDVGPAGWAEEWATRVLQTYPREPIDPIAAVTGYLIDAQVARPEPEGIDAPVRPLWDGLPRIDTVAALAGRLHLTAGELDWFADHGSWLRRREGPLQHYRLRRIPKAGGPRLLEIPKPRLREIQRHLLRHLVSRIAPHPAAHGFRPGRSAASFAAPHAGHRMVLRIDLADFFAHIGAARVRALFRSVGYPGAVAATLTDLCTTATAWAGLRGLDPGLAALLRRRHLPQGSPTSPALSNLALRTVDRRIAGLAARYDLTYTRYADDIALSGGRVPVSSTLQVVRRIVADEGFTIRPDKVHVMPAHQRQRLTGLVVNHHPQVSRREYDALRALLHNAARTGAAAQNRGGAEDFRAQVRGRIRWVSTGSPRRLVVLTDLADAVNWDR